jgi:hypothetical protein
MRMMSAILITALCCTYIHESMCHEDGLGTDSTLFSHAGPDHHHHGHGHDHHDHPEGSDHDSDHHDEDSHDHQFRILIVKKDLSEYLRLLTNGMGAVTGQISNMGLSAGVPNPINNVSQRCNPPNPEYLCAHILRL